MPVHQEMLGHRSYVPMQTTFLFKGFVFSGRRYGHIVTPSGDCQSCLFSHEPSDRRGLPLCWRLVAVLKSQCCQQKKTHRSPELTSARSLSSFSTAMALHRKPEKA